MVRLRCVAAAGGRRLGALALVALALTGCRLLTSPGHDTLTIEIESDVPTSVRYITSDDFAVAIDLDGIQVFHLNTADTTWIELPFHADYDLRTTGMYYVRVAESEDPAAVISFRALVDGQSSWAHSATIEGIGMQYYYRAGF
jgi:hypothetical protein